MSICIYVCMYVCKYVCMCMYMYVCLYVCELCLFVCLVRRCVEMCLRAHTKERWVEMRLHLPCAMSHVSSSCHTHECVMWNMWIRHVTHMNVSWQTYKCVMSHIWMRHVTLVRHGVYTTVYTLSRWIHDVSAAVCCNVQLSVWVVRENCILQSTNEC